MTRRLTTSLLLVGLLAFGGSSALALHEAIEHAAGPDHGGDHCGVCFLATSGLTGVVCAAAAPVDRSAAPSVAGAAAETEPRTASHHASAIPRGPPA